MKDIRTQLHERFCLQHQSLAVCESCTSGYLAQWLTEQPGVSQWFLGGFLVYSNQLKIDLLRIPPQLISQHGAVSEQVALAMAIATLKLTQANHAISITGIAGPTGGSPKKPIGTIYIGYAGNSQDVQHHIFKGNRQQIRTQTVQQACIWLRSLLDV